MPAPGPHSNRQLTGPISLKVSFRHGHTCRYKSLGSAKTAAPANRARTPRQHTRQRHTIYTLTSYTTRRVIIGMDSPAQAHTSHHAARPVLTTRPTPGSTLPPRPQFKPCSQGTRRSQGPPTQRQGLETGIRRLAQGTSLPTRPYTEPARPKHTARTARIHSRPGPAQVHGTLESAPLKVTPHSRAAHTSHYRPMSPGHRGATAGAKGGVASNARQGPPLLSRLIGNGPSNRTGSRFQAPGGTRLGAFQIMKWNPQSCPASVTRFRVR